MGRRSDFERVEKDYYRTFDRRAGKALAPFVDWDILYIEPFAGAGDLIENLNEAGIKYCDFACDIEPKRQDINEFDALKLTKEDMKCADAIISNPPWNRPILHKAIEHFAPMIPTWFLLDANWAFTKQAKPYLDEYCTDIVTIGRLIWIEGTKTAGKDDCCWYRFSIDKKEPTRFYGRN